MTLGPQGTLAELGGPQAGPATELICSGTSCLRCRTGLWS